MPRPDHLRDAPARYVSPSQLNTFHGCPRKWGFDKLDKIRYPKPAAELGSAAHAVLERVVLDDVDPFEVEVPHPEVHRIDPREVATRALPLIPKAKTGMVESSIRLQTQEAPHIDYYGFVDWHDVTDDEVVIVDYKTTGNTRYAMTEAELAVDVQANVYARALMSRYRKTHAYLRWIYVSTLKESTQAFAVETRLSWDDVVAGWEPIQRTAEAIYHARDTYTKASELPRNFGECRRYGGCEYQADCLSSAEALALTFAEPPDVIPLSELVAKARARNLGKQPQAQTPEKKDEDNDMSMMDLLNKRREAAGLAPQNQAPAEPQKPPTQAERALGADPTRPASHAKTVQDLLKAANGISTSPASPAAAAPPAPAAAAASPSASPALAVNAPEAPENELEASKATEEVLKLKADVKKAKLAGAKASKEGTAQILAASVRGLGVEQGIEAATWWLARFGKPEEGGGSDD